MPGGTGCRDIHGRPSTRLMRSRSCPFWTARINPLLLRGLQAGLVLGKGDKEKLNIVALIGSGMYWAWFDALFMGVFFISGNAGHLPEMAAVFTFLVAALVYASVFLAEEKVRKLLEGKTSLAVIGVLGIVGSVLFIASGVTFSWPLLLAGGAFSGLFMGFLGLCWGGVYCKQGTKSTIQYLAGGFAMAIVLDVPLLFMIPIASSLSFAIMPIASAILFVLTDPSLKGYASPVSAKFEGEKPATFMSRYLGVSASILAALCLIMAGFGYLQHLVSFSLVEINGGVIIQAIRGIVAVGSFAFLSSMPSRSSVLYRVGLLAIIAGFAVMAFLFGTDSFWIAGAVIISGYTVFDILKWAVFSSIASGQSKDSLKTIAVMRTADAVFYIVGALVAILLGASPGGTAFSAQESTVVGYLMVIAVVLLLSSEDIWGLFMWKKAASAGGQQIDLASYSEKWGLTQRESDILVYLVAGRTKPWIAENLVISENTVGTHVRHIYQKAGVHGRQELLDCLFSGQSPDSREE